MAMVATSRLSVSDFFPSSSCSPLYTEKLTLNYVYPATLESLVCFSENSPLSCTANVQCDTVSQLQGE